jgi:tetratricopeptide (TPR) repeat protein
MASAVICPACRTRNRPTWDLCVRCGESLEGATLATVSVPTAAIRSVEPAPDSGSLYLVLMLAVLLGTVALACRDIARQPPPAPPSPGVFAFGGSPMPPPSPAPAVETDADLGRRLLGQGRAAEAVPLLERAVAAEPGNADLRYALGRALWLSGSREVALRSYGEAARLAPVAYRLFYAQALQELGRVDEAAGEMQAVLAAQPGDTLAQDALSRIYYSRGDYARAVPLLEAIAARTHDPVILQQLGYAAEETGDRDRAIAAYREALGIQPAAQVARSLLADSLVAAGRKDEALGVIQEGLQRSPGAPRLQRALGSVLEEMGRRAEAAAAYREYARLAPNAPDAAALAARAERLEALLPREGS